MQFWHALIQPTYMCLDCVRNMNTWLTKIVMHFANWDVCLCVCVSVCDPSHCVFEILSAVESKSMAILIHFTNEFRSHNCALSGTNCGKMKCTHIHTSMSAYIQRDTLFLSSFRFEWVPLTIIHTSILYNICMFHLLSALFFLCTF